MRKTIVTRFFYVPLVLLIGGLIGSSSAHAVEFFAKGSVSKNSITKDKWTLSVKASGGLAFRVSNQVRLEARYTNISSLQNRLDAAGDGTITDFLTETSIFSLGLDIDLLGRRSKFRPYIFVGGGYVLTKRSYDYTPSGGGTTSHVEPELSSVSANLGMGVRWMIARQLSIDLEGFAYTTNFDEDEPIVDLFATLGLRIYL